jgi:hypothetical protein
MQRFTIRKKVKGPKKIKLGGGVGGLWSSVILLCFVFMGSGVRGGGKCPEEEHST